MRRFIFITLLAFVIFLSSAQACQELNWSPEKYAQNSKLVYIGIVESISLLDSDEKIDIETYVNSKRISDDIGVTLKVLKPLKGELKEKLLIRLNWCGGGQYELGDLVVAYNLDDSWHVKNTKIAITQSTNALLSL